MALDRGARKRTVGDEGDCEHDEAHTYPTVVIRSTGDMSAWSPKTQRHRCGSHSRYAQNLARAAREKMIRVVQLRRSCVSHLRER